MFISGSKISRRQKFCDERENTHEGQAKSRCLRLSSNLTCCVKSHQSVEVVGPHWRFRVLTSAVRTTAAEVSGIYGKSIIGNVANCPRRKNKESKIQGLKFSLDKLDACQCWGNSETQHVSQNQPKCESPALCNEWNQNR